MRARLLDDESKVFGPQTGILCNLGQSSRPGLFAIVKTEGEIFATRDAATCDESRPAS